MAAYSHFVIMYDTIEGLPVAHTIFVFDNREIFWIVNEEGETLHEITLKFTSHIFSADAFEVIDLPIFVNGEEIISAPPIFASDGTTILVPFREAMRASVPVYPVTTVTNEGNLNLFGGGGGSENSHWQLGRASTGHMLPGDYVPICWPPIIVGGIVYVPLSAMKHNAPFASAWLFYDRIEFYSTSGFPYGTWLEICRENWELTISDEELASFPIIINGVAINNYSAIIDPNAFHRDTILIPLAALADILGEEIDDGEIYIELRWLPWGLRAFIYNGQILIESRQDNKTA
jgi:hypothetical protein